MALTGIGPLMCIHDVSANISSRMNVNCRTIYSLLKTDHFFTVPTDNGPTHTGNPRDFKGEGISYSLMVKSVSVPWFRFSRAWL